MIKVRLNNFGSSQTKNISSSCNIKFLRKVVKKRIFGIFGIVQNFHLKALV